MARCLLQLPSMPATGLASHQWALAPAARRLAGATSTWSRRLPPPPPRAAGPPPAAAQARAGRAAFCTAAGPGAAPAAAARDTEPWALPPLALSAGQAPRPAGGPPSELDVQEALLLSPDVARCTVRGGVASVVRAQRPLLNRVLSFQLSLVSEQELRAFAAGRLGCREDALPEVRFVDELRAEDRSGPFMLEHILDALFRELDHNGDGSVSLEEFVDFCRRSGLLSGERSLRKVFGTADELAMLGFEVRLDRAKFKRLILETGIVEVRTGSGAHYFVEDHVAKVVLQRWFARYDTNGDGHIDLHEYCRLVADYRLPLQVSEEDFGRFDRNGDGRIDVHEFIDLLKEANLLATGEAIMKRDDEEGLRAKWRAIEPTQRFLSSWLVFDTDVAPAPAKAPGMVRFVCISDTHGRHGELTPRLPSGDVLLHAGDFTMAGGLDELMSFARWIRDLPYEVKLVIPGNHDFSLDRSKESTGKGDGLTPEAVRQALVEASGPTVRYLEHEEVVVQGIRVFGTPWHPICGQWAFELPRGGPLAAKWQEVPSGVDVLMVHGPPLGRGDVLWPSNYRVGCADLLEAIQGRIRPTLCVSGHIHEDRGTSWDGTTHYVNATSCNQDYECVYAPLVFDLPARR